MVVTVPVPEPLAIEIHPLPRLVLPHGAHLTRSEEFVCPHIRQRDVILKQIGRNRRNGSRGNYPAWKNAVSRAGAIGQAIRLIVSDTVAQALRQKLRPIGTRNCSTQIARIEDSTSLSDCG